MGPGQVSWLPRGVVGRRGLRVAQMKAPLMRCLLDCFTVAGILNYERMLGIDRLSPRSPDTRPAPGPKGEAFGTRGALSRSSKPY